VDPDERAREVRQRMAALRRELDRDVQNLEQGVHSVSESVSQSARELTDWHFYVERFPFVAAAGALLVGYLVVPKRPQVIVPNAETLATLAKNNQVWVKTGRAQPLEKERGMLGGLAAMALASAGRLAMNWASQQVKATLAARMQPAAPATTTEEEFDEEPVQSKQYPPR